MRPIGMTDVNGNPALGWHCAHDRLTDAVLDAVYMMDDGTRLYPRLSGINESTFTVRVERDYVWDGKGWVLDEEEGK